VTEASGQLGEDLLGVATGGADQEHPVEALLVGPVAGGQPGGDIGVTVVHPGGIKTAKDAVAYLTLVKEELGRDWLSPELFRFGASSLLGDLERQLEYHAFGGYSANYRHPMG